MCASRDDSTIVTVVEGRVTVAPAAAQEQRPATKDFSAPPAKAVPASRRH